VGAWGIRRGPTLKIDRLFPQVGQSFLSSLRRPIPQLEEDRTPGVHNMRFAACDPARYGQHHVAGHASCAENFQAALRELGALVPQPVNFFMHVAVHPDGGVAFGPSQTQAGDWCSSAPSWITWSCSRRAPSNGTPRQTTLRRAS
jgi:uncharacterized protein YcgI (DUF1989 family)